MSAQQPPDQSTSAPGDDQVCVDVYPEHDYREMDERDGIRTLLCSRCGAETEEEADA